MAKRLSYVASTGNVPNAASGIYMKFARGSATVAKHQECTVYRAGERFMVEASEMRVGELCLCRSNEPGVGELVPILKIREV